MRLYRLLATAAIAGYAPVAIFDRLTGRRRLGDLRGRFGRGSYPDLAGGIWVHAVSVGEVGVARNLLATLARLAPEVPLGISVTTAAGRELAERWFAGKTPVFAYPFDLAGPVQAALSRVRPGLVLLTETEIWPLFIDRAAARAIPVALINGRISPRSFARYRLGGKFLARILSQISLFAMQSSEDAERVAALGAPRNSIHVTGNIKYDLAQAAPFDDAERLAQAAGGRPILVAASTAAGEEREVIQAWRPLASSCFLVLAPRRPERFEEVARLIQEEGFTAVRRSSAQAAAPTGPPLDTPGKSEIYLLDSVGELSSLYRAASFAFIGGSLLTKGGHNPIEAWAQGVPVVTGPHMENFREIARRGQEEGFLSSAQDIRGLQSLLSSWLTDPEKAQSLGDHARQFVVKNRGAAEATARLVLPLLENAASRRRVSP